MARLELRQLLKSFGSTIAVDSISMEIRDGEFLAMVGPSGCGKSSTLRMISGLEKPTGGQIFFDGKDVTDLAADKRDVAMVFQNYALYPHMSVAQNLAFPLQNMKKSNDEIQRRIARAASMLGIQDLLQRRPRELSGGQRQRVALGRAIVRDALVFLFDEPLSNLDARLRVIMRSELKRLHQELRQTFVYVTHDQAEAMTMADRIAVMAAGRIQQLGTPDEIYFKPANRFVAEFMGTPSMNFIGGTIAVKNDISYFTPRESIIEIPLQLKASSVKPSAPYELGIRPEAVTLSTQGTGVVDGHVLLVEPLHPDLFLTIDVAGQTLIVRTDAHHRIQVGDKIGLTFDTPALHLFNTSGARIEG